MTDLDKVFSRAFRSTVKWKEFEVKVLKIFVKTLKFTKPTLRKWQLQALKNRKQFLIDVKKVFIEHKIVFSNTIHSETEKLFLEAKLSAKRAASKLKRLPKKPKKSPYRRIIAATKEEINRKVQLLQSPILKLLRLNFRHVYNEILGNVKDLKDAKLFISNLRATTLKSLEKIADRGLPTIIDRIGRQLKVPNYVEMATKANFKRLFLSVQKQQFINYGINLVISNILGDCSIICEPYQGEIFSRGGKHPHYPDISTAEGEGHTTHINCRHFWFPYLEGASRKFEKPSAKEVARNRTNRQLQRSNERQIRRWKRRQVVENSKANRDKIQFWKKRQSNLIKNNWGMSRDYSREEILKLGSTKV